MKSPYNLRDSIYSELMSTYDRNYNDETWYASQSSYTSDVSKQLTTDILAIIVLDFMHAESDPENDDLFNEVTNAIWMVWAGGGTAMNCAKRIFERIGLNVPKSEFP